MRWFTLMFLSMAQTSSIRPHGTNGKHNKIVALFSIEGFSAIHSGSFRANHKIRNGPFENGIPGFENGKQRRKNTRTTVDNGDMA